MLLAFLASVVSLFNEPVSIFCIHMKSGFEIQSGALNGQVKAKVEAGLSLEDAGGEFNRRR